MEFTYQEAENLLAFWGDVDDGDEITLTVVELKRGHSGPGKYAYYTEYPDEGAILLSNSIRL